MNVLYHHPIQTYLLTSFTPSWWGERRCCLWVITSACFLTMWPHVNIVNRYSMSAIYLLMWAHKLAIALWLRQVDCTTVNQLFCNVITWWGNASSPTNDPQPQNSSRPHELSVIIHRFKNKNRVMWLRSVSSISDSFEQTANSPCCPCLCLLRIWEQFLNFNLEHMTSSNSRNSTFWSYSPLLSIFSCNIIFL